MLTLGNLFVLILLASGAAWLWHGHGIRERALLLVRRHCEREQVQLLDDNVALRKLGLLADARGRKRLGRLYGFEFTVTGEQRHRGSIVMFGVHSGGIRLDAHPCPTPAAGDATILPTPDQPRARSGQVIELDAWRRRPRDGQ